jgi:ABC-type nitrate/sulfonate/bicarbonate transport system substrate-binding protein
MNDAVTMSVVSRNYFNMPAWIARDKGFMAAEGIDLGIAHIEAIEGANDMLRDGRAQFCYGVTEHAILDAEAGGSQRIVGGNVNRLPFDLIARPGIARIEDLRGKRIGVSSIRAGSSSLIMRILEGHELRYPGDYELVPCGPILARWELLRTGGIDAGLQGAPLNRIALDQGFVSLCRPREVFPDFQFTSLHVLGDWVAANRDLTIRFMRAFVRAHEWFYANRAASNRVATLQTGVSDCYAGIAWDEATGQGIFPLDGAPSEAAIQTLIDVSGLIRDLPSRRATRAADYIDGSWLEAARASLSA